MGHEGTGVIHALGKDVTTDYLGRPLAEGDRIVHSVIVPCHRCHQCLISAENLCLNKTVAPAVGTHPYFLGTFADYYYVAPGTPVFRVPDGLADEVLGPVNCAMGTATQALLAAGVGEGDNVVIQGAGGLGLTAVAMAKDMGAHRVIVFDRQAKRLEMAREFGADHTVNPDEVTTEADRIAFVFDVTEGRGADSAFEFVGMPALVPEGIQMLRRGGTYVDIGQYFSRTVEFDPSLIVMTGKRLMGSAMYRPIVIATVLDFLERAQATRPFSKLISHRFALEDINHALDQSEWMSQQTPVVRAAIVP